MSAIALLSGAQPSVMDGRVLEVRLALGSPGRQLLEEPDVREALAFAARLAQGHEIRLAS